MNAQENVRFIHVQTKRLCIKKITRNWKMIEVLIGCVGYVSIGFNKAYEIVNVANAFIAIFLFNN